jgi:hypothetical protein
MRLFAELCGEVRQRICLCPNASLWMGQRIAVHHRDTENLRFKFTHTKKRGADKEQNIDSIGLNAASE